MKRLNVLIFISVFSLSVFAQDREVIIIDNVQKTDTIVKTIEKPKQRYQPHAVGIEVNYGFSGMDGGLRYTWNFIPYAGWDVIKLKFSTNDMFNQMAYINALSGIRASTPRFGRSKATHFYTAFRLGVAYYEDIFYNGSWNDYWNEEDWDWDTRIGFTFEYDLGIHFKHFYINLFKYSYLNSKHFFGLGFGVDIGKLKEFGKKE